MKRLFYISILALLTACGSRRSPQRSSERMVKDSTWREIKYIPVDTTFTMPGDSVRLAVPLRDLGRKPITRTSKSGRTTASVSREKETILVDCKVEELQKELQLLKERITEYRHFLETTSESIVIPQPYVPKPVKVLAWIGGIFILLAITGVILFIKKPFNFFKP